VDPKIRGVSFVMTVWLEPQAVDAKPEWRWRVTHVQTGEQAYFRQLPDVLEYVSTRAGVSPPC
jgi:hypothetical protein